MFDLLTETLTVADVLIGAIIAGVIGATFTAISSYVRGGY